MPEMAASDLLGPLLQFIALYFPVVVYLALVTQSKVGLNGDEYASKTIIRDNFLAGIGYILMTSGVFASICVLLIFITGIYGYPVKLINLSGGLLLLSLFGIGVLVRFYLTDRDVLQFRRETSRSQK